MKKYVEWLGSGFAFAVGTCVGVWLMKMSGSLPQAERERRNAFDDDARRYWTMAEKHWASMAISMRALVVDVNRLANRKKRKNS